MGDEITRRGWAAMGRAAALGMAGLLAAWGPLQALRHGDWRHRPAAASWADAAFSGVGPAPGERIAVLVPALGSSGDETALWYAAQYALAPGLVQPVMLRECLGADGSKCRVDGAVRVVAPFSDRRSIAFVERRLRLETVSASGSVLLMRPRVEVP